jgi:hypothetical protein
MLLFLGAGASASAGVPMTLRMLEDFRDSLAADSGRGDLLARIERHLDSRPSRGDGTPMEKDVETVLETLAFLEDSKKIAQPFLAPDLAASLRDPELLASLRASLQQFIRDKCMVRQQELESLRPFTRFLRVHSVLEVFTVIYDIVVELLCDLDNVPYSDGFQLNWQPEDFDREGVRVRLYKLHGSATWYESPSEKDLKVPIRFSQPIIERLSGEVAYPLMMYPAQKLNDSTVFLSLHTQHHRSLRNYEWVVVVGFSFRDEHINKVFQEAARDRPQLNIVLISPAAQATYETAIHDIGARQDLSGETLGSPLFQNRVVRIPFRYEYVLQDFADEWFSGIQTAKSGLRMSQAAIVERRAGNPESVAMDLIRTGQLDDALGIEQYLGSDNRTPEWELTYGGIKSAVQASLGKWDDANSSWDTLLETLTRWLVHNLEVQVNGQTEIVNLAYRRGGDSPPSPAQGATIVPTYLQPVADFFARYANFCRDENPSERLDWFRSRLSVLDGILRYFEENASHPPTLDQLVSQRSTETPQLNGALVSALAGLQGDARSQARAHLARLTLDMERIFLLRRVFVSPDPPI